MTNPVTRLRTISLPGKPDEVWYSLQLWCPACDCLHAVRLEGPDGFIPDTCWDWNGNLEQPTISPSILVTGSADQRCHSFVRFGQWQFLEDSTHDLAGQFVYLVPLPDWLLPDDPED